jgi:hypothetical protein
VTRGPCAVVKADGRKPVVFSGDDFPGWKKHRSNDRDILADIVTELSRLRALGQFAAHSSKSYLWCIANK